MAILIIRTFLHQRFYFNHTPVTAPSGSSHMFGLPATLITSASRVRQNPTHSTDIGSLKILFTTPYLFRVI